MIEVFINLLRALEENVPNDDIRRLIYDEIIPSLNFNDRGILIELIEEDPVFCQAVEDFDRGQTNES